MVQRSGWTRDVDLFLQWLSSIPLAGGGFSDAAIAEGLSEALMVCRISLLNHKYDFSVYQKTKVKMCLRMASIYTYVGTHTHTHAYILKHIVNVFCEILRSLSYW